MVKKKRLIVLILFVILLGIQVYIGFRNKYHDDIKYALGNSEINVANIEEEANKVLELREYYGNDNITGYIYIDDTSIYEPVLKYSDNDYYLHHDNYGKYEINGSIFQDYRISLNDRKVLIYGHSSIYDDIPFNELEKYYSKDFYDNHKYINLITEDGSYKYEIFSVYVETYDFTYMNLKINDETYNNMLKSYKKKSMYDTGVEIQDNDEVIILQTCSNDNKYSKHKRKYLLVIGKKI